MSARKVLAVFRKEVLDSLRDRRTLFMMVLLPILLYPLLFIFVTQIQSAGLARMQQERSRVSAAGLVPAELDSLLRSDTSLVFCPSTDPAADLAGRHIWAWLQWRGKGDTAHIYYDGAREKSRLALSRLRQAVERYRSGLTRRGLARAGVDTALLEPFGLRAENTAPPSRMGGMVLGILLPILLIVTMMMGAMYPAMDLTAGEKERGTMETIMAAPIEKRELFLGKFLTVAAIALMTGALNLLSIMMTFSAGLVQLGAATGRMEFSLSPASLALIFLSLLPLALFISAVLITVSLFARSFKDAQNLVTPAYLILFLPTQLALMPGIQLNRLLALVPVANVTLLFKDIMLGEYSWGMVVLVFLTNSALAFLAVSLSARLFGSEDVLLAEGKGWHLAFNRAQMKPAQALPPAGAMALFSLALLLLFYLGGFLQIKFRLWGVLATLWALILLPALAAAWYAKLDFRKAFHLGPFRPLSLAGTLMLCLGAAGLAAWMGSLQARIFPESMRMLEGLKDYLDLQKSGIGLLPGLFVLAISPGICEEMFFRGALLSSFRRKLPGWAAVALTALLFALVHLNLFRLVPTFLLGLYLGFIVHRTGSIFLSMTAHALNNGLALVIAHYPALAARLPWLAGETSFPASALLVFTALAAAGLALISYDTRTKST